MPIYDYVCVACGRRVEVVHGMDAPGPASCEVCDGSMRKALSLPAIVFKGAGWAKMDARTGPSRGAPGDDKAGEAPTAKEGADAATSGKNAKGEVGAKAGETAKSRDETTVGAGSGSSEGSGEKSSEPPKAGRRDEPQAGRRDEPQAGGAAPKRHTSSPADASGV